MSNKRIQARNLTLKTAKIFSNDTKHSLDCAILNESDGGACILIPEGSDIQDIFRLVIDPDGISRICDVRWKRKNRVGVIFKT